MNAYELKAYTPVCLYYCMPQQLLKNKLGHREINRFTYEENGSGGETTKH